MLLIEKIKNLNFQLVCTVLNELEHYTNYAMSR